ncbi:YraN family protein [Aeropyrum camini]|uniref:Predicted endonuclease RecB family n=1 Tax=Aeropyrum camini SY1 = JCM 12091 TaxID=1198449 RepID=U3TBL5_9CREN|nr:YraN family protein [Aeropyrum camini]BAN90932.1 predicted endonuclease RecB family [Aeropyrum camini SY1 = JCM 12091]
MAGRRAWRNSEEIAARILERSGFRVLDFHVPIEEGGVEVGEIDIVAEKGGQKYSVEVKAGMADINAVRQAYVNSLVSGMKPMIIARGADEGARRLAEKLGVELIVLPDVVVSSTDDLKEIVEEAVDHAIISLLEPLLHCETLDSSDLAILEAISRARSFREAAERLGVGVEELASSVERLKKAGVLPKSSYKRMRAAAFIVLVGCRLLADGRYRASEGEQHVPRP